MNLHVRIGSMSGQFPFGSIHGYWRYERVERRIKGEKIKRFHTLVTPLKETAERENRKCNPKAS
jgi:hypothetical protein